jgi:hypothetical protein
MEKWRKRFVFTELFNVPTTMIDIWGVQSVIAGGMVSEAMVMTCVDDALPQTSSNINLLSINQLLQVAPRDITIQRAATGHSTIHVVLSSDKITAGSRIELDSHIFNLEAAFYVHVTVQRNKCLYNKTNQMRQFPKFTPTWNSTCFGQFLCPSSGVYSLYTWQWYMSYKFEDSFRAGSEWSCSKAVNKPVWHIPLLSVQWINSLWWTEELSETYHPGPARQLSTNL